MVRGDLERLVLTENLGRLLTLEGCLAGNLPAGEQVGGTTSPEACGRARRASVRRRSSTGRRPSSIRRSCRLRSCSASNSARRPSRLALPPRKAALDARRQGLPTAEQEAAATAAFQEVITAFQQQLINLAIRYGQSGVPRIDDPTFVSSVVFDSRAPGQPKARFSYLFPSADSALISIRLRPELDEDERGEAIDLIREAVADPAFELRDSSYVVSGVPVVADGLAEEISSEIFILLAAALAMMTITLALVFGPPLRLLPLAVALGAAAVTFGVLAATGGSLTMASLAVLPVSDRPRGRLRDPVPGALRGGGASGARRPRERRSRPRLEAGR